MTLLRPDIGCDRDDCHAARIRKLFRQMSDERLEKGIARSYAENDQAVFCETCKRTMRWKRNHDHDSPLEPNTPRDAVA